MKKTILVLLLSAAGFIAVWRFEPSPPESVAVAQPRTSTPTASGAAAGATEVTLPGSVERNRYGTVQVQLVFTGDKITDVQLLQEPDSGRGIAALPTLREEALRAQSANIDTVSGATQTSESYAKSLQAALDAR
jgi:uncharacterized protein with FMN-binding domain